ncbi:putative quinol monooxygenase [Lacinutrix undariae]
MKSTIVKFTAKPAHATSFAATLKEAQAATQKEAGNKDIKVFVSNTDANVFFVYERWADKAAITSHDNEPHTQKLMQVGQTALQTAPDFYFLGDTNPLPDRSKSPNAEDELFIIFFIFKLKPNYKKQVLAQFEDHVTNTRKEEQGNILFDLYTVDDQEDTLAVYEHWRKESDVWDIHFHQPYAMKTGKLLEEAVEGDLKQYMHFVTEI